MKSKRFKSHREMTEKSDEDEIVDLNDDYSDEISVKSGNSFVPLQQDEEENTRRTPSSLNNFSILPPIRSATNNDEKKQAQVFIRHLQEKYHTNDDNYVKTEAGKLDNDAKLDDAFLKMKRLDKALEEAFEKEKQVKIETMSLMKKLRTEMQSMTMGFSDDPNSASHTQTNLKRFLALDDEILKFDGNVMPEEQINPSESIFKTQLSDPLGDSNSTTKSDKDSNSASQKPTPTTPKKKKSSLTSTSTGLSGGKTKKGEKDFIKRNIELAKEQGGTWALTDDEKQRLNELLNEDEQDNSVALPDRFLNGYVPSMNENQRLKEIDELLEKEYYNPLLNHQLRRNTQPEFDYTNLQQITDEENQLMENPFGERTLKETRLQREHMQRLRKIDEQLEDIHRPKTEEKIEAILSDDQLNELLGQCAVDQMKQRFSYLNRDEEDRPAIDFDHLSDFALTHYVEENQPTMINDDIIQMLINEAKQEGITMRKFPAQDLDDSPPTAPPLSLEPAVDRPLSTTSNSSYFDFDYH